MVSSPTCRTCGNATVVDGACASCGAGVVYRRNIRFAPKRARAHQRHQWGYVGPTTETGVKARKERCTRKGCVATRIVEVE